MPLARPSLSLPGAQGARCRFHRYPSAMDACCALWRTGRVIAGTSQCGPDLIPTQPDGSVSPRTAMEASPVTPPPPSVALVRSGSALGVAGVPGGFLLNSGPAGAVPGEV